MRGRMGLSAEEGGGEKAMDENVVSFALTLSLSLSFLSLQITAGTGADVWLEGAPVAVHCNKEWYSADDRDVKNGVTALELVTASVSS